MQKQLWIKIGLGLLFLVFTGCSSKTELVAKYNLSPAKILTDHAILVQAVDADSVQATDMIQTLLEENGYTILQDLNTTGDMLAPFGMNQVEPTNDSMLITVKLTRSPFVHNTVKGSSTVTLSRCNYLRKKNPCTSQQAVKRHVFHQISYQGNLTISLREAGKDKQTTELSFEGMTQGTVPVMPLNVFVQQLEQKLLQKWSPYLKKHIEEKTGIEIDQIAADMISQGFYDSAIVRLNNHESDDASRLYGLGYIEEIRKNPSGAVLHYREGAKLNQNEAIFDRAIQRVEQAKNGI